jgi:hypothetical protein
MLDSERSTIDVLRQYRHDWLNRLQMIYAYVQLNKPEELRSCLQTIMLEEERANALFRTGCPELGIWLLLNVHRFASLEVRIRVERVSTKQSLPLPDLEIVAYVEQMLIELESTAAPRKSKVAVEIGLCEHEGVFNVEFSGETVACEKRFFYTEE